MKKEIKKPVKSFEPTAGWRLTMKDIPEKDRPYEKCEREGVWALTDAELLAILIRTGNRQESALSLATRILAQAQPPGILGLLHLTLPELMEQKGIGRVKGIELLCVGELSQRIWRTLTLSEAPAFTAPEAIAAFYMEEMRHKEQEEMHLMILNTKQTPFRNTAFRTDYAAFVFADLLCAGVCIFHSSWQHHALDRKNHQSAVSSEIGRAHV